MIAAPDFVTKLIKPLEINDHYQLSIIIESQKIQDGDVMVMVTSSFSSSLQVDGTA